MTAISLDFDNPAIVQSVEVMRPEELDAQPFGIIRLDAAGVVTFYSAQERRHSGYRPTAVGRRFFTEVAPCMNNPDFAGRIVQAAAAGTLDVAFDYVSDLPSGEKDVELRVRLISASDGGTWIFIDRD